MNPTRGKAAPAVVLAIVLLATAGSGHGLPADQVRSNAIEVAQAEGTPARELEPRYTPVPPEQPSWYNSSYIFGMTRSVAASTMIPAAKVPLFVLTVPLDLVFLPFAAIGGLFG